MHAKIGSPQIDKRGYFQLFPGPIYAWGCLLAITSLWNLVPTEYLSLWRQYSGKNACNFYSNYYRIPKEALYEDEVNVLPPSVCQGTTSGSCFFHFYQKNLSDEEKFWVLCQQNLPVLSAVISTLSHLKHGQRLCAWPNSNQAYLNYFNYTSAFGLLCSSLYCPVSARNLLSQFSQNSLSSISDHPQHLISSPTIFPGVSHHLACVQQESGSVNLARSLLYPWCFILVILHPLTHTPLLDFTFSLFLLCLELSQSLSPTARPHCSGPYTFSDSLPEWSLSISFTIFFFNNNNSQMLM